MKWTHASGSWMPYMRWLIWLTQQIIVIINLLQVKISYARAHELQSIDPTAEPNGSVKGQILNQPWKDIGPKTSCFNPRANHQIEQTRLTLSESNNKWKCIMKDYIRLRISHGVMDAAKKNVRTLILGVSFEFDSIALHFYRPEY